MLLPKPILHDRWFLGVTEAARLHFRASVTDSGIVRVHDDSWERACLDVDLVRGSATERTQDSLGSNDPSDWSGHSVRIQRRAGAWQILVDADSVRAWSGFWERTAEHYGELARRSLLNRIGEEVARRAEALCHEVRKLRPGWLTVAPSLSTLLDYFEETSPSAPR
jgi:hypothetical protein